MTDDIVNQILRPTNTDPDFGFSFLDHDQLKNEVPNDSEQRVRLLEVKLAAAWAALQPFLLNLQKDPEKDYLRWPNRARKVADFELKLREILLTK